MGWLFERVVKYTNLDGSDRDHHPHDQVPIGLLVQPFDGYPTLRVQKGCVATSWMGMMKIGGYVGVTPSLEVSLTSPSSSLVLHSSSLVLLLKPLLWILLYPATCTSTKPLFYTHLASLTPASLLVRCLLCVVLLMLWGVMLLALRGAMHPTLLALQLMLLLLLNRLMVHRPSIPSLMTVSLLLYHRTSVVTPGCASHMTP